MTGATRKDALGFVELDAGTIDWFPALFRATFGKEIAIGQVRRKYDFSHLGKPMMGLFAVDGRDEPVAFTGLGLFRTRYRGHEELSCQFTDSMVHPGHQGRGIYLELLARMQQYSRERGFTYSIGFVNQSSFHPVVHRMKWDVAARMVGYRIPAARMPARRVLRRIGMDGPYLAWAARRLAGLRMEFAEGCLDGEDDDAFIVHDRGFVEHRRTPAHFLLRLEGTPVWIKLAADLQVGVLHLRDEARILAVVDRLRSLARGLGLTHVMLHIGGGTAADRVLERRFPKIESWPVCYRSYGSRIPMEAIRFQACDHDGF